ncbi:TetR/AcrR family transcriptional regulator [Pseudonocardia zijingensis]|jgi:AcrR family transcriptional regulator|uniref:TetR/AcrR family transcriptional regulator n=1 Tax=Pseudonocardia zijingensis TaxID=153376 RepID=A0ABP3ZDK4_9PSEU
MGESQEAGRPSAEQEILAGLPASPRVRRLLQDLESMMMRDGFARLSLDDVAKRLRCSKTTLYRLAGSRDELFALVIELWLARSRDRGWVQYDAATDWPGRLTGFLSAGWWGSRGVSAAFMRDLVAFPVGYDALLRHQDRRQADLEEILRAGVAEGAFQDVHPKLAAALLLSTWRHIVDPNFLASVGITLDEAFIETQRIFTGGLLSADSRRGDAGRQST